MAIPPFPSHDLAKLVLGYLAEEQLMTAYDEFLQASPYLDALRNEYDRIFMTSLKNILAEYRALKIYVETCKPVTLRRKLFQCTNLLDTVKFLVNHIDLNKINPQDVPTDKNCSQQQNSSTTPKPTICEVCNSLNMSACVCKSRENRLTSSISTTQVESSSLESSVEATPLAALPGNLVTSRRKNVRILEKDTQIQSSSSNSQHNDLNSKQSINDLNDDTQDLSKNNHVSQTSTNETNSSLRLIPDVKQIDTCEAQKKLEEFNNILERVRNNNSTSESRCTLETTNSMQRTEGSSSTFQDFASGVIGIEHVNTIVPDSSTSENFNMQGPVTKEFNIEPNVRNTDKPNSTQCNFLLKVGNVTNRLCAYPSHNKIDTEIRQYARIKPKPDDAKIKIISDIKVDNKYNSDEAYGNTQTKPPVLKNATSTPLMQMKTIVINGTPAYRHKSLGKKQHFTKDEIMAMPTIIVVPSSGPTKLPIKSQCQTKTSQTCNIQEKRVSNSPSQLLGPLVIDITSSPASDITKSKNVPMLNTQSASNERTLIKTTDMVKNASVPKDTVVSSAETSTPQIVPPTRKSSSTPRRSSHVRVLDFTTPRRILHETIHETLENQDSDGPVEIIISKSPNLAFKHVEKTENAVEKEKNTICDKEDTDNVYADSTKENDNKCKLTSNKKSSWDADLRALLANESIGLSESSSKPKQTRLKTSKKRKSSDVLSTKKGKHENVNEEKLSKVRKKNSPKTRKKKIKIKCDEEESDIVDVPLDTVHVAVKPTINIISKDNWGTPAANQSQQHVEDSTKGDHHQLNTEHGETPEMDRISLQNAIGVKLNISELLETPYKQALYDIQMETPKFLGPDLPDGPMSDIKIMNIPTPRFLDTPKLVQATPSSYSSRPTDYSSGGSYYKPDEQDYAPIPDLRVTISSPKDDLVIDPPNQNESICKKSCRPVRQCTKNVSYYKHSNINSKLNEFDDNVDNTSSCSDPISLNSPMENKTDKENHTKVSKDEKCTVQINSETKRRNSVNKKRRSPVKKVKSKPFMKIKPRRPTPTKETPRGRKRKTNAASYNSPLKSHIRRSTNSKDINVNITPVIVPVPAKSRRKSSTPRKINCTKTFMNSESSGHDSPETVTKAKQEVVSEASLTSLTITQDSDTEQLALRWSDDGSQDAKSKDIQTKSVNESDDISKIQEYIDTTVINKSVNNLCDNISEGSLQADLIRRGFDVETAKIIERDLLDTPPRTENNSNAPQVSPKLHPSEEASHKTDCVTVLENDESDSDEIELSVHECNEESTNYFALQEVDRACEDVQKQEIKLKDKFSMEVCIDDGVSIRLRATPLRVLFDQDPLNVEELNYSYRETLVAVNSISNIEKLYTPIKDSVKAQCYEIFDSTLTSLDTPLKIDSPKKTETTVTVMEIMLEEESTDIHDKKDQDDIKEKIEPKKRKRQQNEISSDEPATENTIKKVKTETQYLFNSASIQNIDIESVLKKLHGP